MAESPHPLLEPGLPPFDRLRADHVVPDVRVLLAELEGSLAELEENAAPTWKGVVEPLERLTDRLGVAWGAVGHLLGVRDSDALRAAHKEVQADVVDLELRLSQSRPVFDALTGLRESASWDELRGSQCRIVESLLRDARLSGVGLGGAARERFNAIERELAELGTRFGHQLLDSTKAFTLMLCDPAAVEGLPATLRALTAQAARAAGESDATPETGPWRITIDDAVFPPFLQHCRRRELREQVYRARVTRASEKSRDNTPLVVRILELRREQAQLLGFASYAEMSFESKMAPGVDAALDLLEEVRVAAWPAAERDLQELRDHARSLGASEADDLRPWDVPFFAERLREARFDYSDEELRPWFPLPRVLEGLFALAGRLFAIEVVAADGEAPVWHPDVRFFKVCDAEGRALAAFYLDPYSRPEEKRGGAWMDECLGRSVLLGGEDGVRLPVAHVVCNQVPPVGDDPSLMSFGEVETLFHEFGHALQHMLTRVDEGLASGIRNVEWDAVELPSQFMENWCYHRPTLLAFARHVETDEPLPDETFRKLVAARTFRAGSQALRQLHFGITDLELHHGYDPARDGTPFDVYQRVAERTCVLPPIPEDRMLCGFGHLFAGGYAAGYYGYMWADVLAADAFGAFEEAGLDDEAAVAETGRRFRDTVLALGGSRHPMEVFRAFRGREPRTEALLRQMGLGERDAPAPHRVSIS